MVFTSFGFAASSQVAEFVSESGIPVRMEITDSPCLNPVKSLIKSEYQGKFHGGKATLTLGAEKLQVQLCWALTQTIDPTVAVQEVLIIDENMQMGTISLDKFLPIKSRKDSL